MKNYFVLLIIFLFSSYGYTQHWNEVKKAVAFDRYADDNFGFSVAIDGNFAVIGSPYNDYDVMGANYLSNSGSVYIYKFENGNWNFYQKLTSNNRRFEDLFGYSVAIKGDYIVVGCPKNDFNAMESDPVIDAGAVYVFKNISGTWTFNQKLVASDRRSSDWFGNSVSIDGYYIIVGALYQDYDYAGNFYIEDAGAAYLYKYNMTSWTQIKKLTPSNRTANEYYGFSVDIYGANCVVGAYFNDYDANESNFVNNAGAVFVYKNISDVWSLESKLVAADRQENDFFGCSVAIYGDYIVAGAYGEDHDLSGGNYLSEAGASYIFKKQLGNWIQQQKIIAPLIERASGDRFGSGVDIYDNYIIIGAYLQEYEDPINLYNSGAAYIFKNNSDTWENVQKIYNSDREGQDYFGYSVGISGDYLICGAYQEDHDENSSNYMINSGSAFIFFNSPKINIIQAANNIVNNSIFDCGEVNFGMSSQIFEFTLQNIGATNLLLSGTPFITLTGVDASDFVLDQSQITSPIVAGYEKTFTVTFAPSTVGTKNAQLGIQNNDPTAPNFMINLTGLSTKYPQIIENFALIPDKTYGDEPFSVSATASSGLEVIFISTDPSVATCEGANGSIIHIHSAGTCQIIATQPGNAYYQAAEPVIHTLVVNPKEITVFPNDISKIYGYSDPLISYTYFPELVLGDSFNGSLSRIAGENVGSYAITIGSLSAGSNYNLILSPKNFVITPRPITVNVTPGQSKIYRYSDPSSFAYTYTGTLVGGDSFTGSLSRESGENVGFYQILQGTLNLSSNYQIIFNPENFQILPRAITVTANSGYQKIYGSLDPTFGYTYTGSIYMGDGFSGALSREPGENVGIYQINLGTLTLGSNYNITFIPSSFQILPKSITVQVFPGQYKTYGETDPTINYWVMGSLQPGDTFSGQLGRESGENVGFYQVNLGTLSAGPNYNITLNTNNFEIKKRWITINVDPGQTKQYGDPDPVFTYSTNIPIAPWDSFSGSLERVSGEAIGNYQINQGTLSLNSNYQITFNPANFQIVHRQILVFAEAKSKIYGDPDPELTYTYTGTLLSGDSFSGSLVRNIGENVGIYQINVGTLNINSNYVINYHPANFEILSRAIIVTANSGQNKIYGEPDPVFSYTYTGTLFFSDNFTGQLQRQGGENVGTYSINIGTLSINNNYNLIFYSADFEILLRAVNVIVSTGQTKQYGDPDPQEFIFTVNPSIASWDSFSGNLTRVPGENVGLYQILQGTLALNSNYTINYFPADFEIMKKPIDVYCDANQHKIYGDPDPTSYSYTYFPELIAEDEFSGSLTREAGENVGLYEILQGSLSINDNYEIIYHPEYFEITKATPVIVWNNPSDIYYGTPLSGVQLNAEANIPGSFVYEPDFGTILEIGEQQILHTTFYPEDDQNYNIAEASVYINVLLNTSTDRKLNELVTFYPNPTKDFVFVQRTNNVEKLQVSILDLSRKLIFSEKFTGNYVTIDVSDLKPGVYILKFTYDKTIETYKLFKE